MPIQLWFGDFIHGVMEEAYVKWKEEDWKDFPWDWKTQIREIELTIHKRMESRGLQPPYNLFCPFQEESETQGLCHDNHHPHKLLASVRADASINTWGPHLFPLVDDNEVRLKGVRDMPDYKKGTSRSNYYGVTGVIDVLSSVKIEEASDSNLIIKYLHRDPSFQEKLNQLDSNIYEIIVDYKGMKRPSLGLPSWNHHHWQVQTYGWLRSLQPESNPVLIGILFYLNELVLLKQDLKELKKEVKGHNTDIMPDDGDMKSILKWNPQDKIPSFSESFKHLRSIRITPMDDVSQLKSLEEFDRVVADIEKSIIDEVDGQVIQNSWKTNPNKRTCDACDYKTFCKDSGSNKRMTVP